MNSTLTIINQAEWWSPFKAYLIMVISGLAWQNSQGGGHAEDKDLLGAFETPSRPSSDYLRDFLIVKSWLSQKACRATSSWAYR